MKTKQYLFGTMFFCASAAFISCSSDDDNFTTPVQPEKGLATITVGSPTIEPDGASTRMSFTYGTGLSMAWEANDLIRISDAESHVAKYSAASAGASSTFNYSSGDALTGSSTYSITYGTNGELTNVGKDVSWTQTQSGNNSTTHLKDEYQAILKDVNTYTNVTFSSDWATSNGGGSFVQSSCLKLDLTLPIYASLTSIKKLVVNSYYNETSSGGYRSFWIYRSNSAVNEITLTFDGLTSITGNSNKYNLIGYFMLTPYGMRTKSSGSQGNCKFKISVYYGDGESDFIYRIIEFADSSIKIDDKNTNPNGGKLHVIKLNSTGWQTSAGVNIP